MIFKNDINIDQDKKNINIDVSNDGTVSTTTEPPPGFTGAEILITNDGEPVEDAKVTLICIGDLPEVFTAVEQSDGKYRFEDSISAPYDLECELIVEKDG